MRYPNSRATPAAPDLAFAGLFAIVTVSLLSAIVPVLQAVKISPALAFRKIV